MTTRKEAQRVFERFLIAINGHAAKDYSDVGGYQLDYNSIYGGIRINQICNSGGGIEMPFGDRRPLREFCNTLNFAIRVVEAIKIITRR